MDDATYDLDGAGLAEVRRRVVDPVVHAMLAPDELDWLRVQIAPPHDRWDDEDRRDGASYVWVVLSAAGDQFQLQLSEVLFERVDASWAERPGGSPDGLRSTGRRRTGSRRPWTTC